MKAEVDEAFRTGDTRGGVFEVVAHNVPVGLGSHITWDSRLDGRLAQAILSVQALKAVEIGRGMLAALSPGSKVQDTIHYDKQRKAFHRGSNRAGGLEGGMTNGEDLIVRGYIKPISTLRRPLESVDLDTREPAMAAYERSDVAVVPAAGVIGEADGVHRSCRGVPGKVRRRLPGRNQAQLRGLSETGAGVLISLGILSGTRRGSPCLWRKLSSLPRRDSSRRLVSACE